MNFLREQSEANNCMKGDVIGSKIMSNMQKFTPHQTKVYVLRQGQNASNVVLKNAQAQTSTSYAETRKASSFTFNQQDSGVGMLNDGLANVQTVQRLPPVIYPGDGIVLQIVDKSETIPTPGPGHYNDDQYSL